MKELLFIGLWPVLALVIDDGHNDCEPELQESASLVGFLIRALCAVAVLPIWFAVAAMVAVRRRLERRSDGQGQG